MTVKKFVTSVFVLFVFVFMLSSAEAANALRVGVLAKLNSDADEFGSFYRSPLAWEKLPDSHGKNDTVVFYDSLVSMVLALSANEIDEADLPGAVGTFMLNERQDMKVRCIVRTKDQHLVFGFLKDKGEAIRDRFNKALSEIRRDGTLEAIKTRYLKADDDMKAVEFEKFEGAETIKVAITGDLPPIDFVNAEGKATGYNTALLAKIAKRLKVNIRLVYVNSAARSSALVSGRVDVVFWYQLSEYGSRQHDIPDGVIVSEPYYSWNNFVHLALKKI